MKTPGFWYGRPSRMAALLTPLGFVYDAAGRFRHALTRPYRPGIPVLCIGNLVAGGTGKTPVALSLGRRLLDRGVTAHFLSRGYGGQLAGPAPVDPLTHTADDVGDEPLLLIRVGPAWIARDRVAGAKAIEAAGASAIIMDDGFQNPTLAKTVSIVVIGGRRGVGNGRLIPAGPLRERPEAGLQRADAVVLIGDDKTGLTERLTGIWGYRGPLLRAHVAPCPSAAALAGRPVIAFAGIAHPEKLFDSLAEAGAAVVGRYGFPDHHPYEESDLVPILADAERSNTLVVTTEKDHVRVPVRLRSRITALPVTVTWEDESQLDAVLAPMMNP